MLRERADFIIGTTEQLQIQYSPLNLSSLRQIGEERGIRVIESQKALLNVSLFHPDIGWLIFYRRSNFIERSMAGLAHELGHAVLDHRRIDNNPFAYDDEEEEADFFAESLLGVEPLFIHRIALDELHKLSKHPLIYLSQRIKRGGINRYCAVLLKEIGLAE